MQHTELSDEFKEFLAEKGIDEDTCPKHRLDLIEQVQMKLG